MAGKRFVSGPVTVHIKYNDRGKYVARVCLKHLGKSACERVTVGVPRSSSHAVDSARAYHDAAHAAISFSRYADEAMPNVHGTGHALRKPRRAR